MEEVKKRWKDTKRAVKKKQRKRKSGLQKLAGGPQVVVTFKPWELDLSIFWQLRNPYVSILFLYILFLFYVICVTMYVTIDKKYDVTINIKIVC